MTYHASIRTTFTPDELAKDKRLRVLVNEHMRFEKATLNLMMANARKDVDLGRAFLVKLEEIARGSMIAAFYTMVGAIMMASSGVEFSVSLMGIFTLFVYRYFAISSDIEATKRGYMQARAHLSEVSAMTVEHTYVAHMQNHNLPVS